MDPWADPDDFSGDDDFPESGSPRRPASSIRRIAENDEAAEAAARKADSRAAAQAFAADDDLPSHTRDSGPVDPWADSDDAASADDDQLSGARRARASTARPVSPWADPDDTAFVDRSLLTGPVVVGSGGRVVVPWGDSEDVEWTRSPDLRLTRASYVGT